MRHRGELVLRPVSGALKMIPALALGASTEIRALDDPRADLALLIASGIRHRKRSSLLDHQLDLLGSKRRLLFTSNRESANW